MPRAFTYEEVQVVFSNDKCFLLSDSYKNRNDILKFRCSCGNIAEVKFSQFLQGTRCSECVSENKSKAHRFRFDYVKEFFEINGCQLIEKDYKNTSQKLKYECSCGTESEITFRKFRSGQRCVKCGGTEKLTINDARERFEKYGFTLLEDSYINASTKMSYLCKCGRESKCCISNLKRHGGCDHCKSKRMPASKQQRYISELLGGEFNYPYDELLLDVAFTETQTYLECDFSGHWISVQYKQMSLDEFNDRERRRRVFMNYQGWIEVRLISRKDWLLEESVLKELLNRTLRMARVLDMNLAVDLDEGIVYELDTNAKIRSLNARKRWRL